MRADVSWLPLLALAACNGDYSVSKTDTDSPDVGDTEVADTDAVDTDLHDTDLVDTDVADTVDTDPGDTDGPPGGDADLDAVADGSDLCPGEDDRIDLNQDATPDCAQTLQGNAQVTSSLADWSDQPGGTNHSTAAFSATDATGWSHSGAVRVVNQTATSLANAAGMYGSCVPANPGETFDVWYHYSVPAGGGTGPQLITSFDVYSDGACQNAAASTTPGPPATLIGGGWHVMHMGAPLTMWPQWHSFRARIELYKPGLTTPLEFGLDDLLVLEQ